MKKADDWRRALGQLAEAEGMDISAVQQEELERPKTQKLIIKVEKRGGPQKKATIIYGYDGSDDELAEFGALLRKRLSTGGSARGGEILLQGDVAEKLAKAIEALGHKVKIQK